MANKTYRALVLLTLLAVCGTVEAAGDTNPIYGPCTPMEARILGDAFTIGAAINGNRSGWLNDTKVISPCNTTDQNILSNSFMAVFRPIMDQLSVLNFLNDSLLTLSQTYAQSTTLVIFGQGRNNDTITSPPKSFMSQLGIVPSLTAVIEFQEGYLKNFTWSDEDCASCGTINPLCLDGNCVNQQDYCAVGHSNSSHCIFGINIAFSGTDRNKKTFKSWYQISNTQKYSLLAVYLRAKNEITNSIIDIGNRVDVLLRNPTTTPSD